MTVHRPGSKDGRLIKWEDGWMDGWTDGWMCASVSLYESSVWLFSETKCPSLSCYVTPAYFWQ